MVKAGHGSGDAPKDKGTRMRTDTSGESYRRGGAQIDPRIQNEIGKHLRAIYDDVINEPVPSKFMELLEKLERSTTQKN
jgi:Anti-sigma factor NepR